MVLAAAATVVPEAVLTTAVAEAGADSPSLESLDSPPPGRLARLLVDLHRLRHARLLAGSLHGDTVHFLRFFKISRFQE